jgi:hypothetical protein
LYVTRTRLGMVLAYGPFDNRHDVARVTAGVRVAYALSGVSMCPGRY